MRKINIVCYSHGTCDGAGAKVQGGVDSSRVSTRDVLMIPEGPTRLKVTGIDGRVGGLAGFCSSCNISNSAIEEMTTPMATIIVLMATGTNDG